MTDRDRVQLLFGPYKAPALQRGDRAFCLVRDCEVVVTGWTDARIPWPRCRALDSLGPGSGPLWAPEEIALLGTMPDEQVAGRMGRTVGAVRQKREELRIPNPASNRWTAEGIALLGTLPDREVARRLGRPLPSVTQKRIKLDIGNPFGGNRRG
jgi:hypothetical protein